MAVVTPFIGRAKSADNIIHASGAFHSGSTVVSLSQKKDQKVEKQLAFCMKEIQQSMKASKISEKNLD